MPNLFPVFDVPKIVGEKDETENSMKGSVYFDFEKGDFALDKSGKLIESTPYDAWQQWCLKTVYTERFAFLGYSDQVGTEMDAAFSQNGRKAQESAIVRTVTEALLSDPYGRTVRVYDFVFRWDVDKVAVTFTVSGIFGKDATLTAKMNRGRAQ